MNRKLDQLGRESSREAALRNAAWHDDREVVRQLVEQGVKPDAVLIVAAGMGHVALAKQLLESGANVHAVNKENRFSVIEEYVAFNGDDAEGQDPGGFLEMMSLLLSHGADLGDEMFTALNPDITEETNSACIACFEQWRRRTPPVEVPVEVFRRGADAVKTYFAEWEASQVVVARSKICVVGPSTWGKTSFVKTLTSGIPTTETLADRTIGIDFFPWAFSRKGETRGGKPVKHEVTFWDFGGQDVYRGAYSIFYSPRTLFLLCVDLAAYARVLKTPNLDDERDVELALAQFFDHNILRWVRLVFARQPKAEVVLVGTKSDAKSVTGDVIASVKQDVSSRLKEWAEKIQSQAGAAAEAVWLITSSKNTVVAHQARKELAQIVGSSGRDFVMPDKYFAVLERVRELRTEAGKHSMEDRLKRIFRNEKALRDELNKKGGRNAPTVQECKEIFQILHDLGDLLYFENTNIELLKSWVILDPRVIVDLVRQIVRHDRIEGAHVAALETRGFVPHALLKTLPLWKDVDEELTFALKELVHHFRIAYPAGQSRMTAEADLIVPALWTLHEPVNQTSAQFEEALQGFRDASGDDNLLTLNWEYDFPQDALPESFYEEVVVECYHPHVQAVVLSDCIDLIKTGDFAARLRFLLEPARSKIQIEAAGWEPTSAWGAMRFLVCAVELVLTRFPGVRADSYISVKRDDQRTRFNLETVLNTLERGERLGSPMSYPAWMPADCDLQWFAAKAWGNSRYFADIRDAKLTRQQLDRVDEQTNMLRQMAIIGEENRELPALWTAERLPTRTGFTVRVEMLSDLSGRCFHDPIEISVLPELIGAYGDWIQAGLSILSTVAPSGWLISPSDLLSALGIDNAIGKAVKVHNLIEGTSLKTSGFIDTSADDRLDTQRSRDLLRKLLEIHDSGQFDPRDIPNLSKLECGIIKNSGVHVWAAPFELDEYPAVITRRANFPSPALVQAQIVGPLQGFLVIRRVTGLTDWDWREMFVEWQLEDGAGTNIAGGRTSSNPDASKAPQWSDKKRFPIDSIEDLQKMTLTAKARRRSRWRAFVKTIGAGSEAIADVLPSSARAACVSIRLPEGGRIECELGFEEKAP